MVTVITVAVSIWVTMIILGMILDDRIYEMLSIRSASHSWHSSALCFTRIPASQLDSDSSDVTWNSSIIGREWKEKCEEKRPCRRERVSMWAVQRDTLLDFEPSQLCPFLIRSLFDSLIWVEFDWECQLVNYPGGKLLVHYIIICRSKALYYTLVPSLA